MMLDKNKQREYDYFIRKKINEERLKELDNQKYMEYEERKIKDYRQRVYKNILDDQVQVIPASQKSSSVRKSVNGLEPNPCKNEK
jgi:hypothetical protein